MTNSRKKSIKKLTTKRKLIILIVLSVILFAFSAVAYTSHQYQQAKRESIELLEENNGLQADEDIEFYPETEINEFIHVLLIGVDNDSGGRANTDTMMIAQYQPKESKAKLISLMRDTYVPIPGYRDNKINAAFSLGGPELLRQTIKENFDIDIHYYALIDFSGFVRVVDIIAPEGIEINIQSRMYYAKGKDHINFQPGRQNLDGEQALNYVRFRSDHENDFGRVRRQQEVLTILKDELLSFSGVTRLPKLIGSIEPYIQTNIANKKILDYGRSFFLNPIANVETLTIPLDGSYVDSHYRHAGAVLEINIEKNKQALHQFLELETLDEE